jgi:hypothetical protein
VQSALRLTLSEADVMSGPAAAPRRVNNKFLAAGAAIVTAGALAASPLTPSLPADMSLPAIAHHAVELTALSATDSPLVVYPQIFTNTFTNISALTQAILADPLPILSQVARNQLGYAEEVGSSIAGIPQRWQTYSTGRGATFLAAFQTAMAAGDTGAAVNQLSSYILYGLQAALTPIYAPFLTTTPRGSTVPVPGIPERMADNFANAVGALFSTTSLITGVFQSAYGMSIGTLAGFGDGLAGIARSVEAGDPVGAINAAVNLPGLVVNAFLNGWQHPQSAAPFPALLTFIPVAPPTDPANGVTRTGISIGLLGRLLVSIPKSIAAAITPPATAPANSTPAATAVAATEVAETKALTSTGSESATATTESTATETAESGSASAASVPTVTSTKAAKKTPVASTKGNDDKASAGAGTGGTKKAGTARSARAKASASSSSDSE